MPPLSAPRSPGFNLPKSESSSDQSNMTYARDGSGIPPHGFLAFCDGTSLAGFRHIGDGAGRGMVGRLLFTVFVLAATAFAIWYSQYYIASFLAVTVVTNIDTTTAPLADVFFPSVSLCNVNQVQQSFLDYLNMTSDQFSVFVQEFIEGRNAPTPQAQIDEINAVLNSPAYLQAFLGLSKEFGVSPQVVQEALQAGYVTLQIGITRAATQPLPGEMVPFASYNGQTLISNVAAWSGSDIGICAQLVAYTFNYTQAFFTEPPPVMLNAVQPGVRNGENNGMTILLDAEVYDYAYRSQPGQGWIMALHHHQDVAVMRQMGFNVAPGSITSVAVTPLLFTTTSGAQSRFGPVDRDCYYDSEIQLAHWWYNFTLTLDPTQRGQDGRYSMGNCLLEAALQKIETDCKCAPSFNPLGFNLTATPVCEGYGLYCMNEYLDQMGQINTIVDRGVVKQCLAACEDQVNNFQISSSQFPNYNTYMMRPEMCYASVNLNVRCATATKRRLLDLRYPQLCTSLQTVEAIINATICNQTSWTLSPKVTNISIVSAALYQNLSDSMYAYAAENMALVSVWMRDPYVTRLKRDEAMPVIEFVGGFGGLLGLCTGFTMISGAEVVYYLFDFIAHAFCRSRSAIRKPSAKRQKMVSF